MVPVCTTGRTGAHTRKAPRRCVGRDPWLTRTCRCARARAPQRALRGFADSRGPAPLDASASKVKTFQIMPAARKVKPAPATGDSKCKKRKDRRTARRRQSGKGEDYGDTDFAGDTRHKRTPFVPISVRLQSEPGRWRQEVAKSDHSRLRNNKSMKAPTAAFRPDSAGSDSTPRIIQPTRLTHE